MKKTTVTVTVTVIVLITIFVISGIYFALRYNAGIHTSVIIDTNIQGVKSAPPADGSMAATDSTLDKITDLVADLKIVKDQMKLIDSISNNQRHISLIPILEDSINHIYVVKVAENNGTNYVTYFNIMVDAKTMKVLNPTGKIDAE